MKYLNIRDYMITSNSNKTVTNDSYANDNTISNMFLEALMVKSKITVEEADQLAQPSKCKKHRKHRRGHKCKIRKCKKQI